ncbi:hypothetical protein DID73_01110 [Candidatus Marinamargulisbacteria bacterium SCGC AG-343-K17]|nr:hypothetical protein DID73_01110 [Candidatus Marinamargulisbacteria bacterium SCGC AG-343-K17]
MTTPEDKKRWKKEANQLKKDLDNKQTTIKKREVNIKFPKKNPYKKQEEKKPSPNLDHYFKDQINFD